MKLVTTAAALDLLGPAFTWRTPVFVEGQQRDGVWHGNLYIQGSGDPRLGVEQLWLLLRRVQALGIRHIQGDIVLDRSVFSVPVQDPGGFDGEPLRPYNAAPDALLINFKTLRMQFVPDPDHQVARVHMEPPLADVKWPNTVPLNMAECSDLLTAVPRSAAASLMANRQLESMPLPGKARFNVCAVTTAEALGSTHTNGFIDAVSRTAPLRAKSRVVQQ
jgi:D-alanyl-D-alanine carboxypeptidase/D-alanyl-D-alanine-endopeptidase (penicillin-binding protein 4)